MLGTYIQVLSFVEFFRWVQIGAKLVIHVKASPKILQIHEDLFFKPCILFKFPFFLLFTAQSYFEICRNLDFFTAQICAYRTATSHEKFVENTNR